MTTPESNGSDHSIGRVDVTQWQTRGGQRLAKQHQKLAKRIGSHGALIATLAIGGAAAAIASFGAARIYDGVTSRNGIQGLDGPALALGKSLRSPTTDTAAAGIAYVFGPIGMPILSIAAGAALASRQRQAAPLILVFAAGAGSLAMTIAGKGIIHRNRPHRRDAIAPYETSPSFPSGHTLNATTVLGTVAYLVALSRRRICRKESRSAPPAPPQRLSDYRACFSAPTGSRMSRSGGRRAPGGSHW